VKIIDTHQHLLEMDLFSYTWCRDLPQINHSHRMIDYLEAIDGLGIERSVHVEADVDEPYMLEETRHVFRLAERKDNPLAGVVGCARPEKDGFEAYLDQIVGDRALKGIRRILHAQPDSLGQGTRFVENVRRLSSYGLSFDLCVLARQLPIATNLVKRCPNVTFILDHCGIPEVKAKGLDPWRLHIRELAGFGNVVCKVSGLVAYANPTIWTPEDLRPFVDHVLECFGWDRVMFGSDWPVCTLASTLRRWVETLLLLTTGASEASRHKLFYENASRVYRLD